MKADKRTFSFQPTPEVRDLLVRAQSAGLEITEIINNALRENAPELAREMAKDASKRLDAFLKDSGGSTR